MTRYFYRCLVALHPVHFRRQFSDEMLWIFDEAALSNGAGPFFADAFFSLGRQWLIREGVWKIGVAAIGGLIHISLVLGGLSSVLPR